MPRKLRQLINFHDQRFMQISESHCAPAVTQMLLSNVGKEVTQEQVAEAGGATRLIELQGMRVDQLAQATAILAPELLFYYKEHATMEDLLRIVIDYHTPVGVEWQGVFEDDAQVEDPNANELDDGAPSDMGESDESDYGHYSLVVQAYRRKGQLIIADPYKDYFSQARIFSFTDFEKRWYDFNEVIDPQTQQPVLVEDYHMLFVVVHRNVSFPRRMGMRLFH